MDLDDRSQYEQVIPAKHNSNFVYFNCFNFLLLCPIANASFNLYALKGLINGYNCVHYKFNHIIRHKILNQILDSFSRLCWYSVLHCFSIYKRWKDISNREWIRNLYARNFWWFFTPSSRIILLSRTSLMLAQS